MLSSGTLRFSWICLLDPWDLLRFQKELMINYKFLFFNHMIYPQNPFGFITHSSPQSHAPPAPLRNILKSCP
jgi:hypothetical protein